MLKNTYKYFFYLTASLIVLSVILITFNTELRRKSYTYLLSGYKLYMIVSLQSELKKQRPDFIFIRDRLNNYLNVSNKLANGKSKILIGIYDVTKLVQPRIINDIDQGKFENFYKRLVQLDPLMYEAKIWYAKSLIANQKLNEAYKQINLAIKISPLDPDPYRLGIKLALENNENNKLYKYCENFLNGKFGGKQKRYSGNFFTGFNLNKFGLQFVDKKKTSEIYTHSGINLNSFSNYEIVPKKPIGANKIKLFFSFIPGTYIEFKKITLFSEDYVEELNNEQIIILSNNSFLMDKSLIFTKDEDEIIEIYFKKDFKKIEKILLTFKVKKLQLTNYCKVK